MKLIPIKDIFKIEKGSLQSTKSIPGQYDFITASSEWKNNDTYSHDCEALIVAVAASGSLGRTHYVNGKFIASDLCFILQHKSEDFPVNLSFYNFVFQNLKNDLVKRTATGSSKLSINKTNFGKYKIPYIDIDIQNKFSKRFEDYKHTKDKLLSEYIHQQDLVSSLKQQILQDAVTGKLTKNWRRENSTKESANELLKKIRSERENLIKAKKIRKNSSMPTIEKKDITQEIPNSWVICRFGEYALLERGRFSVRPRNDPTCFGGDYPFIQIGSLDTFGKLITDYEQTLNEKGLGCSKMFEKGTLVIAIVGGTIGNLGVLGRDMCFPDSMVGIRPRQHTNQDYILLLLRYYQPQVRKLAYQMAGQPNIKLPTLNNLPCALPPIAEQEEIVEIVGALMKKVDQIDRNTNKDKQKLELLEQAVMSEVFS